MIKKRAPRTFAVCIDNNGYLASLEAGKLYQVVPDEEAEKHGLIRVIDESGDDYGYSAERFFALAVPSTLEKLLKSNPTMKRNGRKSKSSKRFRAASTTKRRLSAG